MLAGLDIKLLYLINKSLSNHVLDVVMPFVSNLIKNEFIALIGLVLLFSKKREIKMSGILLLASLAVAYSVVILLKNSIARPRPFTIFTDLNVLEFAKNFSFPSGHTATAFVSATILSKFFKKSYLFFAFASLVAIARVYMGVHFPSDVIGGALIGIVIGNILVTGVKDLQF